MRTSVIFFLVSLLAFAQLQAQVKIGDNPQNIDPAAVLELESSTMALIITRVSTEQMEAIVPSQGALVYNTDSACVHYYNGTEWVNLCAGANVNVTADAIVNQLENSSDLSTIVLTQTDEGTNIEVATESITGNQILDGSIFGDDFNDNSITGNKLANNAVTKIKISENAVGPFAIDRDSLPLSFFNNDVPFLTAGDITTVSDDANNSLSSGGDGGAFFDAAPLFDAVANDLDGDPGNELQGLSRSGNDLILTQPDGNNNTVSLQDLVGADSGIISQFAVIGQDLILTEDGNNFPIPLADLAPAGNATDELQDLAFDATTNILTVTTPATVGNQVDLSSLAGGNTGSTEFVDGTTLTGLGTAGDPFKIEPSLTNGQFLSTDATGAVVWDDLPGGTGGAVNSDEMTITGDGVTTDLSVLDGGITPIKIEPSANNGDFLTTDGTGAVAWTTVIPGGGTTEEADQTTITGIGTNIDPFKIEPSPNNGDILTTDAAGAVAWAAVIPGGTTEEADQTTITGIGTNADPFKVEPSPNIGEFLTTDATGAVAWTPVIPGGGGTTEVVDGTTLTGAGTIPDPFKIEPSPNPGEVLITDALGDVVWAAGGVSGTTELADQLTITGDGQAGTEFEVADNGITADKIGADVAGTGLLQNVAGALELDPIALALIVVGDGDITGTGITVGGDANALLGDVTLEITDDAITADKIGVDVAGTGLLQNAAGALEVDPTALVGNGDITGTGITVGGDANALVGDVTLEITDGAITADKIGVDVAGMGLLQNAAGALELDPTALVGDGDITGTGITVGGDANALHGNVTLEITDDAITADKIGVDVAGAGLIQNAAGALELDPAALVGNGDITGPDFIIGGDTNALLGDVTLAIAIDAVTADNLAADVVGAGLVQNAAGALELDPAALVGNGDITGPDFIIGGDTNALLGDVTLAIAIDAVTADNLAADVAGAGLVQNATGALEVDPTIIAGNLDDQTAAEVTVAGTATNYTAATPDVEAHLVGINTALAGGGTDNQQLTLELGNLLTLEDGGPAIDLTSFLDNQTAAEVTVAGTATNYTAATPDVEAHLAGINTALAGGGGHLSTTNLTQTAAVDRTYDINGGNLIFTGIGNVGIGNGANPPSNKLHVAGAIRSQGYLNSGGVEGVPSYRFNDDINTGLYNPAADQIGFSVGAIEALRISEAANATRVTINETLELIGPLADGVGATGAAGDVLTATAAGTLWATPGAASSPVKGIGKVDLLGNAVKITTGFSSTESLTTPGLYTVTFPAGTVTDANYTIQLSVQGNSRIFITAQTTTSFTVGTVNSAFDLIGNPNPSGFARAAWHFTILEQ